MYIRIMDSLSIVRAGRKFSKLSTFVLLMIISLSFLLLITLISPDENKVSPENDILYRRDNHSKTGTSTFSLSDFVKFWKNHTKSLVKKTSKKEDKKNRLSELPTWPMNQSVFVEDYIDIYDPHSFIIQPTITNSIDEFSPYCGNDVKILMMVASAPSNFIARRAIRETWGLKKVLQTKGGRLVFVLGRSDNSTLEELVAEESAKHDDMVVEDFSDTYHNLTLKSVALLKWVNITCNKKNMTMFPKYVLKTDDDIFINFDRLLKVTHDLPNARMIGRLTCGAVPIGDTKSKLYMPKYLYASAVYPGYLSGTAYVLKSEIIPTLLLNTLSTPLIHLEDIYVTGLLARQSNPMIYPEDSPFFTYNRIEPKDDCAFRYMVDSHQIKPKEMRTIYANLKSPPRVACNLKKSKWLRKIPRFTKRLRAICLFK